MKGLILHESASCYLDAEEAIEFGIATGIIEKW